MSAAKHAPPPPERTTTAQRLVAASAGSLLTSLFVTPLEVVKVRLQAQQALPALSAASTQCCTHFVYDNGLMEHICPKEVCDAFQARPAPKPERFTGALDAARKIVRAEGLASLWRGLPPTLVMALPANVFYFAAYDSLKEKLAARRATREGLEPLLAGGGARFVAATVVAPLELIRTRMQSLSKEGAGGVGRRVMASLLEEMRAGGTLGAATTLFRGLGPTLLRDVPFSMIYWTAYESTKRHLRAPAAAPLGTAAAAAAAAESPESRSRRIGVSFVSGLAAGSVAATFTTPLDVVKTRVQIRMYSAEEAPAGRVELRSRAWATAAAIWKQDGWRGFFVGLTPRVAKVAPSCAIMISTYEVVKALFADTGAP